MNKLRNYPKDLNGSDWTQIGRKMGPETILKLYRHQIGACEGQIGCSSVMKASQWLRGSVANPTLWTELETDFERARNEIWTVVRCCWLTKWTC